MVHGVIELPEQSFSGTEAKTFILTLEKATNSQRHIPLYRSDMYGHLSKPIFIDLDAAARRMDYHHYSWQKGSRPRHEKPLNSFECVQILRGQISATAARREGLRFLHSTDMAKRTVAGRIHIPAARTRSTSTGVQHCARPGDIIITRVGRDLGDKIARVASGSAPISDCLYVIRGPNWIMERIWSELTSPRGQKWFKAHARGVCAKVLNKADLLTFPLPCDIEPWPN
jgi:type I restriction enzyme M protein